MIKRRKIRQEEAITFARAQREKDLFKFYSDGYKKIPMPTLVDALSDQEDTGCAPEIEKNIINFFNDDIDKVSREKHLSDKCIPSNVISFIIPLDFHIPLNSPYSAVSMKMDEELIKDVWCATIVSKVLLVGTAAIKVSYLIISICRESASLAFKDKSESMMLEVYERAIEICNDTIASFQATSFRHNHYFHTITCLSSPSMIKYFIFDRKTKNILVRDELFVHGNIYSEIFNSYPNTEEELTLFRSSHANKTFNNDKIFKLVLKMQEAINLRCQGFFNESIIASDNCVEMSLGYLYCEICIALGGKKDDVYKDFSKIKSTSDLWQELKELLKYPSVTRLKSDIGFNDWTKHCRKRRDDLIHRFLTDDFNPVESLEAIYYSGELIRKLCDIISVKIKVTNYPLSEKLVFLSRATFFIRQMYEEREKNKQHLDDYMRFSASNKGNKN